MRLKVGIKEKNDEANFYRSSPDFAFHVLAVLPLTEAYATTLLLGK